MKKILILLGIFISSVILFGSDNEAAVTVTAEFLAPLKIEVVQNADFGTVIAQDNNTVKTKTDGKLEVTGNGYVTLKWADSSIGTPTQVDSSPLKVILRNEKNSSNELIAYFKVGTQPSVKNDANFILKEGIPYTLFAPGELSVTSKTASGIYKGSITFRVEYTDDPMI
ncbi:hypothetical protein [Fusobacterium ulcerans]|uniref:hypothetical protein n=1 Tax=Fusobacterium ulcerans TaxID=861 RepID=UPI0026EE2576|nr:hypothetical protein [Fusobacterium ulcerans]